MKGFKCYYYYIAIIIIITRVVVVVTVVVVAVVNESRDDACPVRQRRFLLPSQYQTSESYFYYQCVFCVPTDSALTLCDLANNR